MKLVLSLLFVCLTSATALAQTPAASPGTATPAGGPMTSILPDLDKLQAAASQTNTDIGRMRIDKWKTDGESKRQAQSNADSLQRNLTSALPALIDNVRSAPQDLTAGFKLYRNLNALYDVLGSFTESAGAFGPKPDYEALLQQLQVIDAVRRDLGDSLERLTAASQSELSQLRTQVRALQKAAAAAPAPPKKVVVDDTQPAKKTVHKKKPPATSSGSDSGNSTGTAQQAPKS